MTRPEHGMVTAEYTIGTMGAVLLSLVIYKLGLLGIDGPWIADFAAKVRHALSWRSILSGATGFGPW